jgi:uncharacterized protein (TIGR02266 family)
MEDDSRTRGAERRVHPRVPLHSEIKITYPDRERLFSEICANASVGGMFIESPTPVEVGTIIRFELDLAALNVSVRGVGEVVWRRQGTATTGGGSGFGIRFVEMDPRDRQMIYRIVDRFIQGGGQPFDLEGSD